MASMYDDIPELAAESSAIDRRRKIAEAMMAQGQVPMEVNQMAGGYVVPVSKLAGIAKLANAYFGSKAAEAADKEQSGLAGKYDSIIQSEVDRISKLRDGTPGQAEIPMPADELGGGPGRPEVPAIAPANRQQLIDELVASKVPSFRTAGQAAMVQSLVPKEVENPWAKIDPKDYTPESLKTFAKTRDPSALVSVSKPDRKFGTEDVHMGGGLWQTFKVAPTGEVDLSSPIGQPFNKRPTASNVSVSANASTEKKYGEQFASKIAESDVSLRDSAIKAPDLADRANRVLSLIRNKKVITGFGADFKLSLGKAMEAAGIRNPDGTIANTETLAQNLAQNTLDHIKASGLGAGNGFSNADREFLEKAVGGKITLEADAIERLAILSHRAAEQTTKKWNSRVKDIPASAIEGTGISRDAVSVAPLFGNEDTDQRKKKVKSYLDLYAPK